MSFDPVHDSIVNNESNELDSAHIITPIANPMIETSAPITDEAETGPIPTPTPAKTKISDLLSAESTNGPSVADSISSSSSDSKQADSKKEANKKKRKFFLRDANHNSTNNENQKENKSYQTLLINSRLRHLKKEDGEPYWRHDIQFDFLINLFFNNRRIFKNPFDSYDWPKFFEKYKDNDGNLVENSGLELTFFELYLITLLKSNKISKILKDRLMLDINYSLNFVIICLLVNIGRLNTTVNFDHEMKSQFRTYHSIPSLQVGDHLDIISKYYDVDNDSIKLIKESEDVSTTTAGANASTVNANNGDQSTIRGGSGYTMSTVKQLQDTPRIKSILKSINDLNSEIPKNFKEFLTDNKFNLNIISLIFLLCVYEFEIGKIFSSDVSSLFNDIWLTNKINPINKVDKFLWLIYLFKETNFEIERILGNPFNDVSGKFEIELLNKDANIAQEIISGNSFIITKLRKLMPEDVDDNLDTFDKDTKEETEFSDLMKELRLKFINDERNHFVDDEEEESTNDQTDTEKDKSSVSEQPKKKAKTAAAKAKKEPKKKIPKEKKPPKEKKIKAVKEPKKLKMAGKKLAKASMISDSKKTDHVDGEVSLSNNTGLPSDKQTGEGIDQFNGSVSNMKSENELDKLPPGYENASESQLAILGSSSFLNNLTNSHATTTSNEEVNESVSAASVENGHSLLKKKKKRSVEMPIKLNAHQINNLFNFEMKLKVNKNVVSKKHKNHLMSEFLLDLINDNVSKAKSDRLQVGNLKKLKSIPDSLLLKQSFESKEESFDDEKLSEFKINYFKALTRANDFLANLEAENLRKREISLRVDKATDTDNGTSTPTSIYSGARGLKESDFLNEIFNDL